MHLNGSHRGDIGVNPHSNRTTSSGSKPSHPAIKKNISSPYIPEEGGILPQFASHKRKLSAPPPVTKSSPPRDGSTSGSLGKRHSYEQAISLSSTPSTEYPDSLVTAIEAVNQSLEEPKGQIIEVHLLYIV